VAAGPLTTFKRLWQHNRWLTLSFLITLTLALVFIIRAGVSFVYWQDHRDEPIEGWMTIRYIARSYQVDPRLVRDAVGLPDTGPDRRPLIRIALEEGRQLDAIASAIVAAIEADRRARGAGDAGLPAPDSPPAEPSAPPPGAPAPAPGMPAPQP
jgi:hypothetical protein